MSLKKPIISLLVGIFLCFATATFAGGTVPDSNPPIPVPLDYSGVYVDMGLGYVNVDWSGSSIGAFNNFSAAVMGAATNNADGGFTFGGDIGYQINRYVGFEFGWYSLPKVTGLSDVTPMTPALILKSWLAYAALKGMIPISGKLDIFGKVGIAYRSLRYTGAASITSGFGGQINQFWSYVFGAGLQYWLSENWVVATQYLYFSDSSNTSFVTRQGPAANMVTLNLGYKFGL